MGKPVAWQFKDPKDTTHEKGVLPKCLKDRKVRGKKTHEYNEDPHKRYARISTGRKSFFKQARGLAIDTGMPIRAEVRGDYFDSVREGLCRERIPDHWNAAVPPSQPVHVFVEGSESDEEPGLISPSQLPTPTPSTSGTVENQPAATAPAPKATTDVATQVASVKMPPLVENDKRCGVCGELYASDTRQQQRKWECCEEDECTYWAHAACVLNCPPRRITPAFVKSMPFFCAAHSKC